MEWSQESFVGRVTVLFGAAVAGITEQGTAFVSGLGLDSPDLVCPEIELDSVGVVGLAGADLTYLTGRGRDGRIGLWSVDESDPEEGPFVAEVPMSMDHAYEWAVPIVDDRSNALLGAYRSADGWKLEARPIEVADQMPPSHRLPLAGPPDASLAVSFFNKSATWVAGRVHADNPDRWSVWFLDTYMIAEPGVDIAWREARLAGQPRALTSVAVSLGHEWVAGHDGTRPLLFVNTPDAFSEIAAPETTLRPDALSAQGEVAVALVHAPLGRLMLLTASVDGNLLWLDDGDGGWSSIDAPAGRIHGASEARGRLWAFVGTDVWSLPSPRRGTSGR